MRLLQGSGVEGFAGIRLQRGAIIRPLLFAMKSEILEHASVKKIEFREDVTNSNNDYLRNRIRNELMPILKNRFGLENLKPFLHSSLILQDWVKEENINLKQL